MASILGKPGGPGQFPTHDLSTVRGALQFATNTAAGPDQAFDDINVFQGEHRNTSHETLCSECIAWLKEQRTAGLGEKKTTLYEYARHRFGNSLTHAIFDAAYLAAFARRRGRPKKSSI